METTDRAAPRALESLAAASKRTGLSRDVIQGWASAGLIRHWDYGTRRQAIHVDRDEVDERIAATPPGEARAVVDERVALRDLLAEARAKLEALSPLLAENAMRSTGSDPTTVIPIKGFYVYVLRDAQAEVVYVGQSRNVFGRVGDHTKDVDKGPEVETVQLIPCETAEQMCALELSLIREWKPRFNTVGLGVYRAPQAIKDRGRRIMAFDLEALT